MADVNILSINGRLVKDMEVAYTNNGTPVGNLMIAVNERKMVNDEWVEHGHVFEAVMYGQRVEGLEKHLVKGRMIGIEGKLRQNQWEDREGNKRSKAVILVGHIQLLPRTDKDN